MELDRVDEGEVEAKERRDINSMGDDESGVLRGDKNADRFMIHQLS